MEPSLVVLRGVPRGNKHGTEICLRRISTSVTIRKIREEGWFGAGGATLKNYLLAYFISAHLPRCGPP